MHKEGEATKLALDVLKRALFGKLEDVERIQVEVHGIGLQNAVDLLRIFSELWP